VRDLLGEDRTTLLNIDPRPEHAVLIAELQRAIDGPEKLEERVRHAEEILRHACVPGGIIDPQDDQGDLPWCLVLKHLRDEPIPGSALARRWFTHLVRLRHEDHAVSATLEGMAAYGVAWAEMLAGRMVRSERWMQIAANATDHDDRSGLSLVVVVRAALLFGAESGLPVATKRKV
jgi:hypothetical protein